MGKSKAQIRCATPLACRSAAVKPCKLIKVAALIEILIPKLLIVVADLSDCEIPGQSDMPHTPALPVVCYVLHCSESPAFPLWEVAGAFDMIS